MEFGTFILAAQRGYHQTSEQVIRHSIDQAVASEKAGFGTAWFAEHHFNNYSLVPSPLMMVAACSAVILPSATICRIFLRSSEDITCLLPMRSTIARPAQP